MNESENMEQGAIELLSSNLKANVITGIECAKSALGWDYVKIYNNIGQAFLDAIIEDVDQEEMCEMCEIHILGCSSMSSHFMCEGSRCEDAHDLFIDNYLDQLIQ